MKTFVTISPALGRFVLGLAAALLCIAAQAATFPDWWVAIANDRADSVKSMLAQGADPNELSPKGQPAIMQAIRDGAWNVYDLLASNKKTVLNAININRETPLMYLAVQGQTKRAQDLIRRGAMVNRLGWTPLHYAASTGQLETAKMLIANKAIINAPAPDGTTALMMAAYSGSTAMVQLLLDHGAEITTQNLQKLDAADWARSKSHNALATKLDALTERVLKKRAALRDAGSVPDTEPLKLDLEVTETAETNKAAESKDTATSNKSQSSSKYFDLDRFK
ncbi:ankyrin repeat domain-containing protein [Alcaligenaceae bacterium]|nr:ankyrin repeat domain-containing protein [Alcaligenaceae bacterium]